MRVLLLKKISPWLLRSTPYKCLWLLSAFFCSISSFLDIILSSSLISAIATTSSFRSASVFSLNRLSQRSPDSMSSLPMKLEVNAPVIYKIIEPVTSESGPSHHEIDRMLVDEPR